jgi:hypothetical protein
MGKKKKRFLKGGGVNSFISENQVLLAALGGFAAGISIASILGTDKARQILNTVNDSVNEFSSRVKHTVEHEKPEESLANKRKIPAM